jgi:hypothetical protein
LSNWTQIASDISLDIATNSTDLSGTNTFTDSSVSGISQRFYQLSNSNCCSRVIGFVNLDIRSGSNLVANPFYQVDDFVLFNSDGGATGERNPNQNEPMNTLNALFNLYNPWGSAQAGAEILQWNAAGFLGDINIGLSLPEWEQGGNMTLLPGSSFFIVNTNLSTPFTISFVGLVREAQAFQIQTQTNYLSSTAPLSGWITNVTGYVPRNGDTVKLWDSTNQIFVVHSYASGGWTPGTPYLNIGEGFVLITTNNYAWTNSWQRSVCAGP